MTNFQSRFQIAARFPIGEVAPSYAKEVRGDDCPHCGEVFGRRKLKNVDGTVVHSTCANAYQDRLIIEEGRRIEAAEEAAHRQLLEDRAWRILARGSVEDFLDNRPREDGPEARFWAIARWARWRLDEAEAELRKFLARVTVENADLAGELARSEEAFKSAARVAVIKRHVWEPLTEGWTVDEMREAAEEELVRRAGNMGGSSYTTRNLVERFEVETLADLVRYSGRS